MKYVPLGTTIGPHSCVDGAAIGSPKRSTNLERVLPPKHQQWLVGSAIVKQEGIIATGQDDTVHEQPAVPHQDCVAGHAHEQYRLHAPAGDLAGFRRRDACAEEDCQYRKKPEHVVVCREERTATTLRVGRCFLLLFFP